MDFGNKTIFCLFSNLNHSLVFALQASLSYENALINF